MDRHGTVTVRASRSLAAGLLSLAVVAVGGLGVAPPRAGAQALDLPGSFLGGETFLGEEFFAASDEAIFDYENHTPTVKALRVRAFTAPPSVTRRGFQALERLPLLNTLVVEGCEDIEDTDLRALEEISTLKILDLSACTRLGDRALRHLEGMSTLRRLALGTLGIESPITDLGVRSLAFLQDLRALSLVQTEITDVGVRDLSGLRQLEFLDLSGNDGVGDAGVQWLAPLEDLRTLDLRGTSVGDRGAAVVAELDEVRYLYLANTKVTGRFLRGIQRHPELRTLGLGGTPLESSYLQYLADMPDLERVTVPTGVDVDALQDLRRADPDLRVDVW